MITDSKCFQLYAKGRSGSRWCTPSTSGTVGRVSHPIAVHVYILVFTTLKFLTGTHNRTKRTKEQKGGNHAEVVDEGYHEVLQQRFLPQGYVLFLQPGKWNHNCNKTMPPAISSRRTRISCATCSWCTLLTLATLLA